MASMTESDPPIGVRRSTHASRCLECGSSTVFVDNTRHTNIDHDAAGHTLLRERVRRYRCGRCGCAWWERVRVHEVVIETIKVRTGRSDGGT